MSQLHIRLKRHLDVNCSGQQIKIEKAFLRPGDCKQVGQSGDKRLANELAPLQEGLDSRDHATKKKTCRDQRHKRGLVANIYL